MPTGSRGASDRAARARIERERAATRARIQLLRADFEGIVTASSDANIDDEHDPEGSTIAFERAQISALVEQAKTYLDDVERALAKLDAGTYGTCDGCGMPIPAERLAARPAALRCVACAGGGRVGL